MHRLLFTIITAILIITTIFVMLPEQPQSVDQAILDAPAIVGSHTLSPGGTLELVGAENVIITIKFGVGQVIVDTNISEHNQIAASDGSFTPSASKRIIRWWSDGTHNTAMGINAWLDGENVVIEWTQGLEKSE